MTDPTIPNSRHCDTHVHEGFGEEEAGHPIFFGLLLHILKRREATRHPRVFVQPYTSHETWPRIIIKGYHPGLLSRVIRVIRAINAESYLGREMCPWRGRRGRGWLGTDRRYSRPAPDATDNT